MAARVVAGGDGGGKTAGNVVTDLDGVLYLGDDAIPGAGQALADLEARSYRVILVTNNSTRHVADIASHVAEVTGYRPDLELIVSSASATARYLAGTIRSAFVVGEAGLSRTLAETGIAPTQDWREADAVVVGLHRSVGYDRLRDAALAVRGGARFVATNVDPTYPTPGGLWPGGGAIAAAIATAAGVEPEVAGKPYEPTREMVRELLVPGPTWVVGDRSDTDLEMGRLEGWRRVLVLSGVTPGVDSLPPEQRPELVLASIAGLPAELP